MSTLVIPLLPFEKYIIGHAVLCVIGFLGLLPLGALLARYTRTYSPAWFTAHWIVQFAIGASRSAPPPAGPTLYLMAHSAPVLAHLLDALTPVLLTAGPIIITGVALGIHAVVLAQSGGTNDVHKRWGIAIFVLYLAQLALGATVHFYKPRAWAKGEGRRPLQNYFHAVFGLLIIAFAMFQVSVCVNYARHVSTAPLPPRLLRTIGSNPDISGALCVLPLFCNLSASGFDVVSDRPHIPTRSARDSARNGLRKPAGAPSRTGPTSSGISGLL